MPYRLLIGVGAGLRLGGRVRLGDHGTAADAHGPVPVDAAAAVPRRPWAGARVGRGRRRSRRCGAGAGRRQRAAARLSSRRARRSRWSSSRISPRSTGGPTDGDVEWYPPGASSLPRRSSPGCSAIAYAVPPRRRHRHAAHGAARHAAVVRQHRAAEDAGRADARSGGDRRGDGDRAGAAAGRFGHLHHGQPAVQPLARRPHHAARRGACSGHGPISPPSSIRRRRRCCWRWRLAPASSPASAA